MARRFNRRMGFKTRAMLPVEMSSLSATPKGENRPIANLQDDLRFHPSCAMVVFRRPDISGFIKGLCVTQANLSAISKWQIEATREDMLQLFYPIPDLSSIMSGDRILVVGRKGTGKTAIAEYIMAQKSHDVFKSKLSFRDFPFNILYSLGDASYRSKSQYISLWKFVIYCSLCEMMAANNGIDSEARELLARRFPTEMGARLSKTLSNWVTRTFGINVLGTGGNISETRSLISAAKWTEELDALADIALSKLDDCKYYIMFDALDDDYKEMDTLESVEIYLDLLTGLIKAADDVHTHFRAQGKKVYPIIFLRSDIYELIHDNDKNKWRDISVALDWRIDALQRMLAHRISKTLSPDLDPLPFGSAWRMIFSTERIDVGDKIIEQFDYINFRTYGRPRDHIYYLKQCSDVASQKGWSIIKASTVINGEKNYSEYLLQELVDEIHPIIPPIRRVLDIFTKINKGVFSAEEFYRTIEIMSERGELPLDNIVFKPPQILDLLYKFGVIGNRSSTGHTIYRHASGPSNIDFDRQIVLHVGLLRSLQVGNPRRAVVVPS